MYDINLNIVNFFTIPLSFFIVIFSLLVIQSFIVNITSAHTSKIAINHQILFKIMNWWAIFIHEFSHAITAIVTLNQVKEFKVSSNGGHVVHTNNGRFGFIQWIAAQFISASPAFVPSILAMILLDYFDYFYFPNIVMDLYSFDPVHIISWLYFDLIFYLLKTMWLLLINLDYSNVENILLLLVLIFSFSAAKLSSIDKKKYGMQGDLQSLIERFVKHPKYSVFLIFFSTIVFWGLLSLDLIFYLYFFTFIILLPIITIFALSCNYSFINIINLFDNSPRCSKIVSLVAFVLVYALLPYCTEKQFLINITSICVLIGILKGFSLIHVCNCKFNCPNQR